jgi:hypothetical protein
VRKPSLLIVGAVLLCSTSLMAAIPDRSLTPKEYAARQAPAADQSWTADDYAKAAEVLKTLAGTDPAQLPRAGSKVSGVYFARMIAPENLQILSSKTTPPEARMTIGLELLDGTKRLLVLYMESAKPGAAFDDETCLLLGYEMKVIAGLIDPMDQVLKASLDTAPGRWRPESIAEFREGIGAIADAALLVMNQRQTYRVEARRQLATDLDAAFKTVAPELPATMRASIGARMSGLASDERDPQIKTALNNATAAARNLPPSRLETAIAALRAKVKDTPADPIVWSWHTSRDGGFRGEFPGTPVAKVRAGTSRSGKPMSAASLATQTDDGSTYTMLSVQMDVNIPDMASVDLLIGSLYPGAKVIAKSDFTLDGHRGRQALLKADRSVLEVRAVAVSNTLVQAIVETPGKTDDKPTPGAERFFNSMQLVQKED